MTKTVSTRVEDDTYDKMEKQAKEKGMSVYNLANEIIESYYLPKIIINKYSFLEDGCKLRDYLTEDEVPIGAKYGEGFYCLKKAPSLIKLGSGIESAASKICAKCVIREGALEDSRILKEQDKKGIKIQMPICTNGGVPNDDLTKMWCPKVGDYRPIDKKTKKAEHKPCKIEGNNNSNCRYLKSKTVVTGRLKEKDNR